MTGSAGVSGIHIHCEVRGRGRPLLLILGLGADVSEYTALIDQLAARSQVIAFDNRGAGRTDKPDVPYSIELMAADALGVLDTLGVPRACVLGISLGGRIAMELALRHPERVERLILVSTSARVVPSWRRRHLYPILSGMPLFRSRHPQPRYAFVRQLEASDGYDAGPRLHELGMPTAVMHGRSDRAAPLAMAEEMQREIPGSRLVTFRGGHLFFLIRERQRFVDAVADFVGQG
ncbi:MAG: alpha/beta hydrolase [Candidatus Dormibacteria bacterium]|jgi:pimeloyl-ACP methyl ester carboxylesterase